jgi:adenylate cyclase
MPVARSVETVMHAAMHKIFRFEAFTLDVTRGCLRTEDRDIELRPKTFEVLRYLIENGGRLVSKDEIIGIVWPNVIVTDDSIKRCVSELRVALGDGEQRIIKTVPRRGYLFAAAVFESAIEVGTAPPAGAAAADKPITDSGPAERKSLPLPDRPSIAVLPFTNMSGDPQQDYFSDGVSEDLITSLSKFAGLFVIARHSAFRYRGSQFDVRQIGCDLGVRYLLVGSVRRDAGRVRITAQLVDATTGTQLWAEHYDRELTSIFAVQDEVSQKIVMTLIAHISRSELERALRKAPESLAAYDHYLRANAIMKNWHSDTTGEMIAAARAFYEQSIAADANYAPPVHGLAWNYVASWVEPWPHRPIAHEYQQKETLDHALSLAQRAVELDPNLPDAHLALAGVLKWQHRRRESMAEFERAFELNPNLADYRFGLALIHNGRTDEGMAYLKRIVRLDPFHAPACLTFLGNAYYQTGQYAEAIENLQVAARRLPTFRPTYVWLAAAAAQLGQMKKQKRPRKRCCSGIQASPSRNGSISISSPTRPTPPMWPRACAKLDSRNDLARPST